METGIGADTSRCQAVKSNAGSLNVAGLPVDDSRTIVGSVWGAIREELLAEAKPTNAASPLAVAGGLEPPTTGLTIRRSTN
jgi:hypothetical protein